MRCMPVMDGGEAEVRLSPAPKSRIERWRCGGGFLRERAMGAESADGEVELKKKPAG